MICSEITVGDEKRYECIGGVCTETPGGQYTEPTCAGVCKPATDNTMLYILGAAALLGVYLFFGDKK